MPVTAAATFCATLVDEWVRAGVSHAVVAPGSRSTPLAVALASDGRLEVHIHHDERAAGFLALGIALASGVPVVVLTTSGTAAVELHPAVVEAHHSGVPLMVCTADRPPELLHVGAPQTVDQTRLYGTAVRWFADPGVPDDATRGAWRSWAARVVAEAVGAGGRGPGPVQLNLPFREPLLGEAGPLPEGRPGGHPWHRTFTPLGAPGVGGGPSAIELAAESGWKQPVSPAGSQEVRGAGGGGSRASGGGTLFEELALWCDGARGVVVAGEGAGAAASVHALAEALGWPVLADPSSGCRVPAPTTVATFDAVLRVAEVAQRLRPDVVLRLGAAPASKVLFQWLAASGARQAAFDVRGRWIDPERTAEVVAAIDVEALRLGLSGRVRRADASWLEAWSGAERIASGALDALLPADRAPEDPSLAEPALARRVVAAVPDGGTLVVASSMPVRDVEWYGAPRHGLRVIANRGANGIDGVVSTAVGVALGSGAPTVALVGDVAFLHDSTALLGAAGRSVDLTVVVVDNDGGGIFSFLPPAGALDAPRFEQLFGTPHGVDPAALAAVHGVVVYDDADLHEAIAQGKGVRLVRVRTDRSTNVAGHDRVHAAVAEALRLPS